MKLITGNQRIHQLTSQGWYEIRVDMSDFDNESRFAYYRIFSIGNKESGYKLTIDLLRKMRAHCGTPKNPLKKSEILILVFGI